MSFKSILLALITVIVIGLSYPITKIAMRELPPILLAALRFIFAAIPFVWFTPFPKTSIWNLLGVGTFLGVFAFGLMYYALQADIQAGIAALLMQSQVLFTILLSMIFFGDKMKKNQMIGFAVSLLGFSVFFIHAKGGGSSSLIGLLFILCAGFFWAIANMFFKRMKDVNLCHFMIWTSLIPPLPLLLISYTKETHHSIDLLLNTSISAWLSILYQSVIVTVIGYALWGDLLRRYSSINIAPFSLLMPVAGLIGANIILGEKLTVMELVGTIIIMIGLMICVLGHHWKRFTPDSLDLKP
ncbi:EamA family transporter [Shewanella surugensis]|uniref:EamA family transporter n=1 Tax=Shewanella surugensis TaxID=212020 RepID=A0ABT0L5N8_9GAMM|nr:EamA family transporter [Shewanella surugensis]MCL1122998.1 EamA family transporter [Shewanella surugensis]